MPRAITLHTPGVPHPKSLPALRSEGSHGVKAGWRLLECRWTKLGLRLAVRQCRPPAHSWGVSARLLRAPRALLGPGGAGGMRLLRRSSGRILSSGRCSGHSLRECPVPQNKPVPGWRGTEGPGWGSGEGMLSLRGKALTSGGFVPGKQMFSTCSLLGHCYMINYGAWELWAWWAFNLLFAELCCSCTQVELIPSFGIPRDGGEGWSIPWQHRGTELLQCHEHLHMQSDDFCTCRQQF